MIDVRAESLLTIPQAATRLRKSCCTLKRWVLRGVLEGIQLPSGLHTSIEAVERMIARLSEARGIGQPIPALPARARKGDEAATEYLRRNGVLS